MKRAMFEWFRKTRCSKVHEMLSAYIDRELSPQEHQVVETHLKTCQACRAEHDSLRQAVNLLHRMPVASPRRSFAISEAKAVPRKGVLKALSAVTVVAALCLIIVMAGDVMHAFDTPPLPVPPWPQPAQVEKYVWPVRETEYGLLGATIVLAGITVVYWQKRRKKFVKGTRK